MKRILTCFLTLTLLLALAVPAQADVVWEPENRFYETHRDECGYLGRRYYANGPEGYVTMWDAPNGSGVTAQYENGEKLWIYWLWDGWGCVSRWEETRELSGWVDMSQMVLVYDCISFAEEHGDQIRPYNGEFASYDGDAAGVAFYEYPGADAVKQYLMFTDRWEVKEDLTGTDGYIQSIFVDENGLTWGYVGYLYGRLNAWFCLDDPQGDGEGWTAASGTPSVFPRREVEVPELISPQDPQLPAVGYLPYALVGGVVVITAGLLLLFAKSRKKAP